MSGGELISPSILYGWMLNLFPNALTDPFRRHPTAFAGWVGLFVTAINLLPAGQLDGGHVARALFGERSRYLSWGAVMLLLTLGVTFYTGWFLFALIILLLGVRHPPPLNDLTRLRPSRQALGALAIVVLLITFVPAPFVEVPTQAAFAFEDAARVPVDHLNVTFAAPAIIVLLGVNNTGNVPATVQTEIRPQNLDRFGWTLQIVNFTVYGDGPPQNVTVTAPPAAITLNVAEYATVRIRVGVPASAAPRVYTFVVHGEIRDPAHRLPILERDIYVNVTVP